MLSNANQTGKLRKKNRRKVKSHRELLTHLLQSSFHDMVAQVKVNISSHSSSPPTLWIRPVVGLFVDQSTEGSHLRLLRPAVHSHHGVYSSSWERRGKGGGAGGVVRSEWVRGKGEKMAADFLGIWTLMLSCCCLSWAHFEEAKLEDTVVCIWWGYTCEYGLVYWGHMKKKKTSIVAVWNFLHAVNIRCPLESVRQTHKSSIVMLLVIRTVARVKCQMVLCHQ